MAICKNVRQFLIVSGHLVYLSRYMVCLEQEKSGNPDREPILFRSIFVKKGRGQIFIPDKKFV
jgi:hypothetical protein